MERFPLDSVAFEYAERFDASHKGTDIFAARGTVVQAVERGYAWAANDTKGGLVVYLDAPTTANQYYYAHLDSVEHDIPFLDPPHPDLKPVPVVPGQRLGTVGTSGNAKGKPPHLHFQMRENVGAPGLPRGSIVNPYPRLRKVDPHLVTKPWWSTPTVGPGKTLPWGSEETPDSPGKPWWDLSWMGKASSMELLVVGGLVMWFLSKEGQR